MFNFLYRSFEVRGTNRFTVRRVNLLTARSTLRTLYGTIARFRERNPNMFNIAYTYIVDGQPRWATVGLPHLRTFEAFETEIRRQLGQLPGLPGSGTLDLGDDPAAIEIDTTSFDAYISRAQMRIPLAAFQAAMDQAAADEGRVRAPFGPRAGVWDHPKGLGGIWESKLMTSPARAEAGLEAYCVRDLAAALFVGSSFEQHWQALDDEARNDWDVFQRLVAETGKSVVRVDPTHIVLPFEECNALYEQAVQALMARDLDWLNERGIIKTNPTTGSRDFPVLFVPLEHMPFIPPAGPFAQHELPVLYQSGHVDVAELDASRSLRVRPGEFYVRLHQPPDAPLVVKLLKPAPRKLRAVSPAFRLGPLRAVLEQNLSPTWKFGKAQEYSTDFNLLSQEGHKELFVSFDVETGVLSEFRGGRNAFEPFSASWCWLDTDDMQAPDFDLYPKLPEYKETRTLDAVGATCLERFLEWIEVKSRGYKAVTVITVNGAKFDHEFLLDAVMRRAVDTRRDDLKPRHLHLTNSKMVGFKWGKATVFDLNLHIAASLAKMGKDFAIPPSWRKIEDGPSHTAIQDIFAQHGFDMWDPAVASPEQSQMLGEYREYGLNDARATVLVYRAYKRALESIGLTKIEPTIGAQAMKAFQATLPAIKQRMLPELLRTHTKEELAELELMEGLLPRLSPEELDMERRNVVAGAVKLPTGPQVIAGKVIESYDVASQYPTSMTVDSFGWFAAGKRDLIEHEDGTPLSAAECKLDTHVGKFLIDVNQSELFERTGHVVFPFKEMGLKKTALGEDVPVGLKNHWNMDIRYYNGYVGAMSPDMYEWVYEGQLNGVLVGNIELATMLELGCPVTIHKGWIYRNRIPGWLLFDVERRWIAEKSRQDAMEGTEAYNGALRNTVKLLMNAMSGKTMQGDYTETLELVPDKDLIKKFVEYNNKGCGVTLRMAAHHMWFIEVARTKVEVQKRQYPIEWGKKIYEVSRMRILRTCYLPLGKDMIYGDTDCVKADRQAMEAKLRPFLSERAVPAHPEAVQLDPAYGEISLFYAPGDAHRKRIGQLEDEHSKMRKDNPGQWRGAIAAKKMFALTDGDKIKISAKGMRAESRYLPEAAGAQVAATLLAARQRMNELGKQRTALPPHVQAPELDSAYQRAVTEWETYQKQLQTFYEDFEAVPKRARQLDFVHKLEELVRGETQTIYGVTMSFNRVRNLAARGSTMAHVADNHVEPCKIIPIYAVKKISLKTADWGAFYADGQGFEN